MAEGRRRWNLPRRAINRAVYPYIADLQTRLDAVQVSIRDLHGELGRVHREFEQVNGRIDRLADIARHIYDEEPNNRRRLHELRASEDYELAFTESEPLVSFLIPTYDSYETLRDVALPSVLGQDYSNLEVIVVGDCAPPQTQEAIASIADPRVAYFNRTVRGPYPDDPARRWFVVGTPPYDEALARARGRWIAGVGDDDAVRPNHTAQLVEAAQANRYEHCYGRQRVKFSEGEALTLGEFPPTLGQWGLQAAIFHAGLRYFESELSDAIYGEPNDWSMCRRMLRAGVSFGMIDAIVVDKHERRRRSAKEWRDGSIPIVE